MAVTRILSVVILFLFVKCVCVESTLIEIKRMSDLLNNVPSHLETKKIPESEENYEIWKEFIPSSSDLYELLVTNISSRTDDYLFEETENYKFFNDNEKLYLAGSTQSMFMLNILNREELKISKQFHILHSERILTFEVLNIFNVSQIIVLLSVEIAHGSELRWYKLIDENFEPCGFRRIPTRVERLHYFQYENKNRLLTMERAKKYSGNYYSHIDIFGFSFNGNLSDFWLTRRLPDNEVIDVKICSASGVMLAVQVPDSIHIYDYTDETSKETPFQTLTNVKFVGLKNFVCFQSGSIFYLGTSGPTTTIFIFHKDEFGDSSPQHQIINEETAWIESIRLDTWREEVILFVQLMNSSIVGFEWQVEGFERIRLPSIEIMNLSLSKITVIPKFGFVYEDKIVKIETRLKELDSPVYKEMEELLNMKNGLAEIMEKQQLIFDETRKRVETSYLKNSHITGYWEIKKVRSQNVIMMKGVNCANVSVAGRSFQLEELQSDLVETLNSLERLQQQLFQLKNNRVKAVAKNTTEIKFSGDVEVLGELTVHGMMTSHDVTFETLNNLPVTEIFLDLFDHGDNTIIKGQKIFPSINADKLTVSHINGIPIEDIIFDKENIQYHEIKFENLRKLRIDGNLNISVINSFNWQELMSSIVSKSELAEIPGETKINGVMTASHINLDELNGLMYPDDYILRSHTDAVEVPTRKFFKKLSVGRLDNLTAINGISVDEFVLLNENHDLSEKITFENLEILGSLQLDGDIKGRDIQRSTGLLNETTRITSPIIFSWVKVNGKIQIDENINNKTWNDFRDLVMNDGESVEINGRKEFFDVVIEPKINIASKRMSGHHVDEFVTRDTEQTLNLQMIDANVTFGRLMRGDLKNLEEIFSPSPDAPRCLNKFLTFQVPPIVDKLFVETLNGITSGAEFVRKLNASSSQFTYKNLAAKNLKVNRISLVNVNDMNYEEFISRRISKTKAQVLTGDYEINNLNAGMLHAETIDGKSVMDLEKMRRNLDDLYHRIVNGSVTINNLSVTGFISAKTLNNVNLTRIYDPRTMGTVIFESDTHIRNLNISGLLNLNSFLELVNDSVRKTDRNITIDGAKRISQIVCEILEVFAWNNCPVDLFLNPSVDQVLTGPVVVKGRTIIEGHFNGTNKIGRIMVDDIKKRFEYVTDNVFVLNGNFEFTSDPVSIENLYSTGSIQGTDFNELHDSLVFLNSEDVSITGSKVFKNASFSKLIVTEKFNSIDLKEFYSSVVLIDRPLFLNDVNCSESIIIDGNLIVTKKMEAGKLMDVDMNEMKASAIHLMKPEFVPGTITFENAVFASNIRIEKLNDVDMKNLIPLKEGKIIAGVLRCIDISAGNLEIAGRVNNEDLAAIYSDTFQLNGAQNVTGNLIFSADVNIRRDFDTQYINGIDSNRFITLYDNETITENFIFSDKIILNGSLRVLKHYNGIDPLTWQQIAVTSKFPFKQIISGLWTVNGSVHLKGNIVSSGVLNGTDLRELIDDLRASDVAMSSLVDAKRKDLRNMCDDIEELKIHAEKEIYKFKFFEYLQVMRFNNSIVSVHPFEVNDFHFLFISLKSRELRYYAFIDNHFVEQAVIDDFGAIDQWISLYYRGNKYFVTLGIKGFGRRPGNLWLFADNRMTKVIDLGDITDARKINDYEFITVINGLFFHYSLEDLSNDKIHHRKSYSLGHETIRFVENSDRVLAIDNASIYTLEKSGNYTIKPNFYGTNRIISLRVGVFKKELIGFYDEKISENYVFISDTSALISQTIAAYRADSIVMMNFDGFIENFLIYIEDGRRIRIYEYEGIAGFRYRETLQLRGGKLVTFKLRRRRNVVERNYLGVVDGNKFTILEAQMYGERIDAEDFSCD